MTWVMDAYARKTLVVGEHQLCPGPLCKKKGEVKLNACEEDKWVWKRWFEETFKDRLVR